jgi:hypothetical protein
MNSNNIFSLNMKSFHNVALRSEHVNQSHLWHLRYGHLNYNGLQLLKHKNVVFGLPFLKTAWRANAPLELVHADIYGPTRTPSISNKRYFLLFVDDYSRMI